MLVYLCYYDRIETYFDDFKKFSFVTKWALFGPETVVDSCVRGGHCGTDRLTTVQNTRQVELRVNRIAEAR